MKCDEWGGAIINSVVREGFTEGVAFQQHFKESEEEKNVFVGKVCAVEGIASGPDQEHACRVQDHQGDQMVLRKERG